MKTQKLNVFKKDKKVKILTTTKKQKVNGGRIVEDNLLEVIVEDILIE